MAKLYWRVTINGKRTWRPVKVMEVEDDTDHDPRWARWYFIEQLMEGSDEPQS